MTQIEFWMNILGLLNHIVSRGHRFIITASSGISCEIKLIGGEWPEFTRQWASWGGRAIQGEGEWSQYCTFRGVK